MDKISKQKTNSNVEIAVSATVGAAIIGAVATVGTVVFNELSSKKKSSDLDYIVENSTDSQINLRKAARVLHGYVESSPDSEITGQSSPQGFFDTWKLDPNANVPEPTRSKENIDELTEAETNLLCNWIKKFIAGDDPLIGTAEYGAQWGGISAINVYEFPNRDVCFALYIFRRRIYWGTYAGALISHTDWMMDKLRNDDEYLTELTDIIWNSRVGNEYETALSYGGESKTLQPFESTIPPKRKVQIEFSSAKVTRFVLSDSYE